MIATRDETLKGKTCLVSGSGNVAQFTAEKLIELGAKSPFRIPPVIFTMKAALTARSSNMSKCSKTSAGAG
jgi:hypothetical protein